MSRGSWTYDAFDRGTDSAAVSSMASKRPSRASRSSIRSAESRSATSDSVTRLPTRRADDPRFGCETAPPSAQNRLDGGAAACYDLQRRSRDASDSTCRSARAQPRQSRSSVRRGSTARSASCVPRFPRPRSARAPHLHPLHRGAPLRVVVPRVPPKQDRRRRQRRDRGDRAWPSQTLVTRQRSLRSSYVHSVSGSWTRTRAADWITRA